MLTTTLLLALRALRRNKLRSGLTGLGMIIGVGAVIAMVSIGNGARAQIEARVDALGRNIILIFPGSGQGGGVRGGWGSRWTLKPEDVTAIAREVPHVAGISPEVRTRAQVVGRGRNWNTLVQGVSADYLFVRSWTLAAGSGFTAGEIDRKAKVAIVGQTIVDQLGLNGAPLGQVIRINEVPFQIIGVLAPRGFTPVGSDQDDIIMVPYTSYLSRVDRGDHLNSIVLAASNSAWFDLVTEQITALLRQDHGLGRNAPPDFIIRTQEEINAAATAQADTMTSLLGAIAGVSLLVGGIGIMNIMLVSVTERTREIGIRLAVGAHDSNVRLQFLTEAALLSLAGGVLGVALGIGASWAVARFNGWPVLVAPDCILLAVLGSIAVGIFFGYYPAQQAARLDPIDALRHE